MKRDTGKMTWVPEGQYYFIRERCKPATKYWWERAWVRLKACWYILVARDMMLTWKNFHHPYWKKAGAMYVEERIYYRARKPSKTARVKRVRG